MTNTVSYRSQQKVPAKDTLRARSASSLVTDLMTLAIKEYKGWRSVLRWLAGKTIHCRLLGEASAEVVFSKRQVRVIGRWISRKPTMIFALGRPTLIKLVDGKTTASEAVFSGKLRVSGTSDDLVRAHNVFMDIAESLGVSPVLKLLYAEFKRSRLRPPQRWVTFNIENGTVSTRDRLKALWVPAGSTHKQSDRSQNSGNPPTRNVLSQSRIRKHRNKHSAN